MQFMNVPEGTPTYVVPQSSWLAYGPFGMWLVRALKPRQIVELGMNDGFSYFCFCQAVAEAGQPTRCFHVETCLEDLHTARDNAAVLLAMAAHNARYATFSTLLQRTSAEALDDFTDGAIDLLHICASHSYEDLKEKFQDWVPKLSSRAVVLLHDTEEGGESFAGWRFWQELSAQRPSLSFAHGHGLGVLFWGEETAQELVPLVAALSQPEMCAIIRDHFSSRGEGFAQQSALAVETQTRLDGERDAIVLARSELTQQAIALDKLHLQYEQAQLELTHLKNVLRATRKHPLKEYKNKIMFRALSALSKGKLPISQKAADRFRRSAAKRDPDRDDLMRAAQTGPSSLSYDAVLRGWDRKRKELAPKLCELSHRLDDGPMISIVVPVYNPDPRLLAEMIDSVRAQSYGRWELCIADDCSPNPEVRQVIRSYAATDSRIRPVFREENGHISCATNSAIQIAKGTWIAFVDHDDLLDQDALLLVAQAIIADPAARIVYTDEDKVGEDGKRYDPHFKPDWNRELLYGLNYVSHLGVYEAALVRAAGGLRPGYEGAQDYDLLLRCLERIEERQICHIPKVLYSWRSTQNSTAMSGNAKPYAAEAGRRALEEHLNRRLGQHVRVEPGPVPFSFRPLWPVSGAPLVSIIVPTRDRLSVLRVAVESILQKTSYRDFELIVVDNGSTEPETLAWLAEIEASDQRVRVLHDGRPFNYSALNNAAVAQARGEIVALVNNDVEVIDPEWLTEMVALAQRPEVGCVGAKLLYPDGRIQHAGVVIGMGGVAGHGHLFFPGEHPGYFSRLAVRQEYSAVTAACLLVRREVYDAVGGLNETELSVAFNDVDFCLKVRESGYRNVWTPFARLYHHESVSRGQENTVEKQTRFSSEVRYMKDRWDPETIRDFAFNPNLSLDREDFRYGPPRWDLTD